MHRYPHVCQTAAGGGSPREAAGTLPGHVITSPPWASEDRRVLAEGISCFLEQLELNLVLGM